MDEVAKWTIYLIYTIPVSRQVTRKSPARKPNKYGHAMANKSATNILLKLFLIVSETTIHLTRSVYACI